MKSECFCELVACSAIPLEEYYNEVTIISTKCKLGFHICFFTLFLIFLTNPKYILFKDVFNVCDCFCRDQNRNTSETKL